MPRTIRFLSVALLVAFMTALSLGGCGGVSVDGGDTTTTGQGAATTASTTSKKEETSTTSATTSATTATTTTTTTTASATAIDDAANDPGDDDAAAINDDKGENSDVKEENNNPIATIEMENGGEIVVELNPDMAPNTVKNFIALANSGFYDGLIFHRVMPEFMIQGGDPLGNGSGGPGYNIAGEFSNNNYDNTIEHKRGVISMARRGDPVNPSAAYDTAGSQFFITVYDSSFLDGDYAAFGEVLEGMEVADEIAAAPRDAYDKPFEDQVIKTITVDTRGVEYDPPETAKE